jgi:hypothetical protein
MSGLVFQVYASVKQYQMAGRQRQTAVAMLPRLAPLTREVRARRGKKQGVRQQPVIAQTSAAVRLASTSTLASSVRPVCGSTYAARSARRSPNANRRCVAPASARADSSRARPATGGQSDPPMFRTRACATREPGHGGQPRSRAHGRRPRARARNLPSRSTTAAPRRARSHRRRRFAKTARNNRTGLKLMISGPFLCWKPGWRWLPDDGLRAPFGHTLEHTVADASVCLRGTHP